MISSQLRSDVNVGTSWPAHSLAQRQVVGVDVRTRSSASAEKYGPAVVNVRPDSTTYEPFGWAAQTTSDRIQKEARQQDSQPAREHPADGHHRGHMMGRDGVILRFCIFYFYKFPTYLYYDWFSVCVVPPRRRFGRSIVQLLLYQPLMTESCHHPISMGHISPIRFPMYNMNALGSLALQLDVSGSLQISHGTTRCVDLDGGRF